MSPAPVREIRLDPLVLDLEIGDTLTSRFSVTTWADNRPLPAGTELPRWRVLDAQVGSLVTGVAGDPQAVRLIGRGEGETRVEVEYGGATASAVVRVARRPLASLTVPMLTVLSGDGAGPLVGQGIDLTPSVTDSSGRSLPTRPLTWSLTGPVGVICLVAPGTDTTGTCPQTHTAARVRLAIRQVGTVTLTARSGGVSRQWTLTSRPVPAVRLEWVNLPEAAFVLREGSSRRLSLAARDSLGTPITRAPQWRVVDTSVAQVSSTGLVSARRHGLTVVEARLDGQVLLASLQVTRIPGVTIAVAPETPQLRTGQTLQMSAAVLDSAGGVLADRPVIWTSLTPTVVSITPDGRLTAIAPGLGRIDATAPGETGRLSTSVPVQSLPPSRGGDVAIVDARLIQVVAPVAGGSAPLAANQTAALAVRLTGRGPVASDTSMRLEVEVFTADRTVVYRDTQRLRLPLSATAPALDDTPSALFQIPDTVLTTARGPLFWQVHRDPAFQVPDDDQTNDVFPQQGAAEPIRLTEVRPMDIVLVPVRLTAHGGRTSRVTAAEFAAQAPLARRLIPASRWTHTAWPTPITIERSVVTRDEGDTTLTVIGEAGWIEVYELLAQMRIQGILTRPDLRDAHWVAVFDPPPASRSLVDGIAQVGGRISVVLSADAVQPDRFATSSLGLAKTFAHELLHNFERLHTPCGNPGEPRHTTFPDPQGRIQTLGISAFDWPVPLSGAPLEFPALFPAVTPDVMGYCAGAAWLHPFHWAPLLAARAAQSAGMGGSPAIRAAEGEPVISWWVLPTDREASAPRWGVRTGGSSGAPAGWRVEVLLPDGSVRSRAVSVDRLDHVRRLRVMTSRDGLAPGTRLRLVGPQGPLQWQDLPRRP